MLKADYLDPEGVLVLGTLKKKVWGNMDKELVRGIIRKLTPEKKEIEVPGYTEEQVEEAFSQLVSEGIVSVFLGEI